MTQLFSMHFIDIINIHLQKIKFKKCYIIIQTKYNININRGEKGIKNTKSVYIYAFQAIS